MGRRGQSHWLCVRHGMVITQSLPLPECPQFPNYRRVSVLGSIPDGLREPRCEVMCTRMEYESKGNFEEASTVFMAAWTQSTDDFERCVAAHYVARLIRDVVSCALRLLLQQRYPVLDDCERGLRGIACRDREQEPLAVSGDVPTVRVRRAFEQCRGRPGPESINARGH
jgi:hypothetical protein